MGYPLQAIGVPKTVDNDLPLTDCCPGFGSVAKYIAVSTLEAALDVRSMARTSTKVFVLEVMGRHAGWIAAAGGLVEEHGIPHIILFPEIAFDKAKFLARVEAVRQGVRLLRGRRLRGRALRRRQVPRRAGHEGRLRPRAARRRRAGGRATWCKQAHGYKFHWAVADYLQRAARHIASKTDVQQAYEVGKRAVELALKGQQRGDADDRAHLRRRRTATGSASPTLADVANVEKFMPRDFITADGFGITEKCRRYLEPLIAARTIRRTAAACRCTRR